MRVPTIRLDGRVAGSNHLPETIDLSANGVAVDPSIYTWTVKAAAPTTPGTVLWTKSTGITTSSTTITIAWAAADMGALTAGDWTLDLIGTQGANTLKVRLTIHIDDDVG